MSIHNTRDSLPYFEKLSLKGHDLTSHNLTAAESIVTGVCVKMFTIAGPVIIFGTCASVIYGVIYCIYLAIA